MEIIDYYQKTNRIIIKEIDNEIIINYDLNEVLINNLLKRELGRLEDTFYIPGSNPKPTFFAQAECNALLHIEQSTISPKG